MINLPFPISALHFVSGYCFEAQETNGLLWYKERTQPNRLWYKRAYVYSFENASQSGHKPSGSVSGLKSLGSLSSSISDRNPSEQTRVWSSVRLSMISLHPVQRLCPVGRIKSSCSWGIINPFGAGNRGYSLGMRRYVSHRFLDGIPVF